MIGLDTSFLVGLSIREHPAHRPCWLLFEQQIRGQAGSCALAPQVLSEFAHVVTDPRLFEKPLPMPEALDICRQWSRAEECRSISPGPEAVAVFLNWMHQHALGRKRLLDTLLAATYYSAGVTRIVTTNWRDFAQFGVFSQEVLN